MMHFEKSYEFANIRSGNLHFVNENEFVYSSYSTRYITWIKGSERYATQVKDNRPIAVIDNIFYFRKENVERTIYKAELIEDHIEVSAHIEVDPDTKWFHDSGSIHYFIEREAHPGTSFAIPINKDYRSIEGIPFDISLEDIEQFDRVCVIGKYLLCFKNIEEHCCSCKRYESGSTVFVERNDLPYMVFYALTTFDRFILYMTREKAYASIDTCDLSWKRIETDLDDYSRIVGVNDRGLMTVQSFKNSEPKLIHSAYLPDHIVSVVHRN